MRIRLVELYWTVSGADGRVTSLLCSFILSLAAASPSHLPDSIDARLQRDLYIQAKLSSTRKDSSPNGNGHGNGHGNGNGQFGLKQSGSKSIFLNYIPLPDSITGEYLPDVNVVEKMAAKKALSRRLIG